MLNIRRRWLRTFAVAAILPLGACEGLLEVESPGRIADEDLNSFEAISGIVAGISAALTEAMADNIETLVVASREMWHGGSYDLAAIPRGIILPEDVNGEWGDMQKARWVGENGIERIRGIFEESGRGGFDRSPLVARAYVLTGFANRLLGENVCTTVIDGGEEQPNTVHFERAEDQFSEAIRIGDAAGNRTFVNAAHAGRASVRAWLGDWSGAVQDARQVPTDFVFEAIFNNIESALGNDLAYETHRRPEYTVWNTEFAEHHGDPRIPWDTVFDAAGQVARGANGQDPFFQQTKYTDIADNIPLVKGTEMLVLRAEAALRDNDITGAFALLNEARAFYDMDPLPVPNSIREAWQTLHFERGATVWLENRRLWDLRRWNAAGASSPMYHAFLETRDKCIPISENERRANPNLAGSG